LLLVTLAEPLLTLLRPSSHELSLLELLFTLPPSPLLLLSELGSDEDDEEAGLTVGGGVDVLRGGIEGLIDILLVGDGEPPSLLSVVEGKVTCYNNNNNAKLIT
jgi:hypothetical protein